MQPSFDDPQLRKLAWRCRRGMKELDVLLLRYLQERHPTAPSDERNAFAELLELPDPELVRYLIAGDVPGDPRRAALCRAIRQSAVRQSAVRQSD
ncbi:MAG TPA: succinate dehydrogenase assembly factor 2 [Steroidobacteraceae bacterium]|nr:succinate dehydrogenase assembly factor 2 [Steroidobacteraceae bacterium]